MKTTIALSLLGSLLISAASFADTVNLAGNTAGAPTFTRPTETGARSFFAVPFIAYQFNVATSGAFTFTLNAVDPSSYDTFLHLFANAFNPADVSDPALNFFAANDDASGSTTNSGLTNLTLFAGTTYFLVVDGFSGSDAGAFTASISGPGAINVVPEPSTIALLCTAGVTLATVMRRRSRQARACDS
ncbi:MAG: PEP-CTERM sorting domain-containing protein [Verrucomicrobiota bacterium]|nr:PEP-CTERM sorting domain-containing protein [Verrucomicrobiota bacterium]